MAAARPLDAVRFLAKPQGTEIPAVVVVSGPDAYLRREVLSALKDRVLTGADSEFSLSVYEGNQVEWRKVHQALATVSLFGEGRQMVLVEDADGFVSENRDELLPYFERPQRGSVFVLETKSWPSNTKLAKVAAQSGLAIDCSPPSGAELAKWLTQRAKASGAEFEPGAADTLLELCPTELGLLDQEVVKLAAMAGPGQRITSRLIEQQVNTNRVKKVWDLLDDACNGRVQVALEQLDAMFMGGETALGIFGPISSSLRRFGTAAHRIMVDNVALRTALEESGVPHFFLNKTESQLKRLGRARASQMLTWLLEADLALKGPSSQPALARTVLETLFVRIGSAASSN